ncbi:uncharacterized protein SAMN05444278_102182 [Psychroflexus salarius]|uniref:TPM domain-containing protein n=1 Tax=Psychroflexus salarius TaxID=1155689 RepID=A0A1M4U4N2_9FLAO|nr:TPM domain-containing protein [Psychroflexus salarius]SHE51698.1 uncharacterized protein SAMN05444278_102182 [Psychroflexus salarius]
MYLKSTKNLFVLVVFTLITAISFAQYSIPKIPKTETAVYDKADILDQDEELALTRKLISYADTTSTQIVFVSIKSLQGENINLLAAEWAEKWNIGQQKNDNGLIILMSENDREISIQNGYGLEPYLTDLTTSTIINQIIIPEFKKANYYKGLDQGTSAIFEVLAGKFDPQAIKNKNSDVSWSFLIFPILIVIVIFIIASRRKNNGGGSGGRRSGSPDLFDILVLSSLGRGGFGGGSFGSGSSSGGFGGGFSGGFGGGSFGGGGASGSW